MFELTVYIEWWCMLKMIKNLKYISFNLFLIIHFFLKSPYIFICKNWTEVIASAELDCAYRSNDCYQNSN